MISVFNLLQQASNRFVKVKQIEKKEKGKEKEKDRDEDEDDDDVLIPFFFYDCYFIIY